MSVYSAELLPLLFSEVGRPDCLSLVPVAATGSDPNSYWERVGAAGVRLRCPRVVTFSVDDDRPMLKPKVDTLLRICTRAHGNIATRVSEEHIYEIDEKGNCRIVAGSGSAQYFRKNFLKRLGEVFKNLEWRLGNGAPDKSLAREFGIFESLYLQLQGVDDYNRQLDFASKPYTDLKEKLAKQTLE